MTSLVRKLHSFIVVAVAGIEEIVTLNVLHGTAQTYAVTAGAVLGTIGVALLSEQNGTDTAVSAPTTETPTQVKP